MSNERETPSEAQGELIERLRHCFPELTHNACLDLAVGISRQATANVLYELDRLPERVAKAFNVVNRSGEEYGPKPPRVVFLDKTVLERAQKLVQRFVVSIEDSTSVLPNYHQDELASLIAEELCKPGERWGVQMVQGQGALQWEKYQGVFQGERISPDRCIETDEHAARTIAVLLHDLHPNISFIVGRIEGGATPPERKWGVLQVSGPSTGEWCRHVEDSGSRIETDERAARSLARFFEERAGVDFQRGLIKEHVRYRAEQIPPPEVDSDRRVRELHNLAREAGKI